VARLQAAPFTELSFVPLDAEIVVRVDLAALAARDAQARQMLDFLLRAQQPAAWQVLSDMGLRAGQELRAVYLVVGPRAADGPAMLLAAVGELDAGRAQEVLARAGGVSAPAAGGATLHTWPGAAALAPGATIAKEGFEAELSGASVGVAPGLLLLGPPDLVRRAFAVRAGEGKDARAGALAEELAALDERAVAWGVASPGERGLGEGLAPGLKSGRFSFRMARANAGTLALRAEFASDERARSFAADLRTMIGAAALLTRGTSVGEAFARLRDETAVRVEGHVVTVGGAMPEPL
jgi:hypothetical protein